MGTHISKVKSVDLDVWTPEQMAVGSISCFPCDLSLTVIRLVDPKMGEPSRKSLLGGSSQTGPRSS